MTTVVAALIERDGRILICRRKRGQAHELKWEFPGGKLEAGETPPQALSRELEEELGIQAVIGPEVESYSYSYPGKKPILLIFHRVKDFHREPQNIVFDEIRWETLTNLPGYDFLEGDVDFVRRLAAGDVR
ncbi:MAG TPA: (deoxy)nucleoside triphosphate pyrophosphohydrolase [Bryobacteraceae bacterium]|nr:(deoxy)nucleoside triphosphate pyrophosphohydrolase [Bryobacteraceae bacterium]